MPAIIDPDPITSTDASLNLQPGLCPLCGAELHDSNACDRCDWVRGYGHASAAMRHNSRDMFAGLVSLLWPGAGHFYKGHTKLAIILAAGPILCFIWSLAFLMFLGPLIIPVYWLGVAGHAYFLKDVKHQSPAAPASPAH